MQLTPETAGRYLIERGVIAEGEERIVTPLGGGVSNVVLEVTTDSDRLIVKQPLENLDVEDDWPADVGRVHNEAAAARAYEDAIPTGSGVTVPSIRYEDPDEHVIVMDAASRRATMWKADLLDGHVHSDIATRVGRVLGHVQTAVASDDEVRSQFEDETPFVQLRIDPYHRTIARRYPDLAEPIEREIDRILDVKQTLVHGDYSPKNVLVDDSNDDRILWILDFEVAHWGDPAFDAAFMLNHLFIKSVYNADQQRSYLDAATSFWEAYSAAIEWDLEDRVVRELGILMLARVDGKSPVEYVTSEAVKDELRTISTAAIEDPPQGVSGYRERIEGDR